MLSFKNYHNYYFLMFKSKNKNYFDMIQIDNYTLINEIKDSIVKFTQQTYPNTTQIIVIPAPILSGEDLFINRKVKNLEQEFLSILKTKPPGMFSLELKDYTNKSV